MVAFIKGRPPLSPRGRIIIKVASYSAGKGGRGEKEENSDFGPGKGGGGGELIAKVCMGHACKQEGAGFTNSSFFET